MKRVYLFVLIALLLASVMPTHGAFAGGNTVPKEFYVANSGNDSNDGSFNSPFKTLEGVRDAIREMRKTMVLPQGGIRIYIRGGKYIRTSSFVLSKEDSGSSESPIIYQAYKNENVEVLGGYVLPVNSFKAITDANVLSRLDEGVRKKVLEIDLRNLGVKNIGELSPAGYGITNDIAPPQVYYNDEIINLARWPNQDYATTGELINPGTIIDDIKHDERTDADWGKGGGEFKLTDERPLRWSDYKDAWLFGFWQFDWAPNTVGIREINAEKKTITLNYSTIYGVAMDKRFYAFNILEELDTPGEWFIDRSTLKMYLYPKENFNKAKIELAILEDAIVKMDDVSFVTIKGINFSLSRGHGIVIQEGEHNLVTDCVITKIARSGVVIAGDIVGDNYMNIAYSPSGVKKTGGKYNGVVNCDINNIGEAGVILAAGNRITLEAGNCFAENNKIHKYAQIKKTYQSGVDLWGCGNIARHNEVFDAPHFGIYLNGNEHIVEYNNIYGVGKDTDDAAAIYIYGDFTYQGNVINYNYIHDLEKLETSHVGMAAIYLDGFSSGVTVVGNVINNGDIGIFTNGGKYNSIHNNIIINCENAIRANAFGQSNLKGDDDPSFDGMKERATRVNYDSEIYKKKYPKLFDTINDKISFPIGNEIINNVLTNAGTSIDSWHEEYSKISNIETNIENAEFVNPDKEDFTLKDSSEIYKKIPDFPKIDFKNIGRYDDKINQRMKNAVCLFINNFVALNKGKEVKIDANNAEITPIIVNGRTLLPVRFIAESFGAKVEWDEATKTIGIKFGTDDIKLVLGSKKMLVNGTEKELDVPAQSINGRTVIPLRALVESINKKVFWDPRGLIVVSDQETIFSDKESYLVDSLIREFR